MVTITNGKQVWKITEDEYNDNKAKWNSRGEVTFDVKDPMLEKQLLAESHSITEKPEYDLQTEVEIKLKVDPEVLTTKPKKREKKAKQ